MVGLELTLVNGYTKGKIMAKKGAVKTGRPDPGYKNKNSSMAKHMAAAGVVRTTHRDPITNKIVSNGTYPGTGTRQPRVDKLGFMA